MTEERGMTLERFAPEGEAASMSGDEMNQIGTF
jgi:hypothetical protein